MKLSDRGEDPLLQSVDRRTFPAGGPKVVLVKRVTVKALTLLATLVLLILVWHVGQHSVSPARAKYEDCVQIGRALYPDYDWGGSDDKECWVAAFGIK